MLQTRIAQRKSCAVDGLYKILDRNRFYARSYQGLKSPMELIDISTTGCAFKVKDAIPKGSYVEIELNCLSDKSDLEAPIIAACEVVYSNSINRTISRVGAKFLEIDRKDIEKIRKFTE